jgi:hypothetical protein
VPFSGLTQQGWGYPRPAGFDPTAVLAVQLHVDAGVAFDLWLDDVRFYEIGRPRARLHRRHLASRTTSSCGGRVRRGVPRDAAGRSRVAGPHRLAGVQWTSTGQIAPALPSA